LRSRTYVDHGFSPAEDDHHAFLWWAKDRLVVVPIFDETSPDTQVVVYHVDGDGTISRVGAVSPPQSQQNGFMFERSLVVGDVLYTVSDRGVLASGLHSLRQVAWVPFR
jgi:hypothetical protein